MKTETIQFDREKFQSLKKAYERASLKEEIIFIWEGKEFLLEYARYLLEYLSKKFEK